MDYMTSSPLASGGIGVGKPGDLVSGATDRSDAVKRLKENGDSFIRPVVSCESLGLDVEWGTDWVDLRM